MRKVRLGLVRSLKDAISSRFQQPHSLRTLSANALAADEKDEKSFEHLDDSKRRISSQSSLENNNKKERAVLDKIDSIGKGLKSLGSDRFAGERSNASDIFDKSIASIQGQDASEKLRKAAMAFDGDTFEHHGRSRVSGPRRRVSAVDTVTTTTVLKKADFRNTRFLAKFITEGGIIMKRNQTGISAKAQRKIAREIKTARSMGLLPFTTQGTKSFVFGRSMQDHPDEYEYVHFGGGGASYELPSVMDDIDD